MQIRFPSSEQLAARDIQSVCRADFELMPLRGQTKVPYDKEWRVNDYSTFNAPAWIAERRNVGIRLRPGEAVLDIDPRHGGTLEAILAAFPSLKTYPRSATGGGGWHIFLSVPETSLLRGQLEGFEGVDIKRHGGFVVAAGSRHPETGKLYRIERGFEGGLSAPPGHLLVRMSRPLPKRRTKVSRRISNDDLHILLTALKAQDYGAGGKDHGKWLDIAMAVHHGTGGDDEARDIWLEWCAGDEQYGDEARDQNERRWESFSAEEMGGITVATLFKAVSEAGRADIVATMDRISAAEDFEDDDGVGHGDNEAPGTVCKAGLTIVAADGVEQQNIEWLWPGRIALGKLTGIAGVPDQGKSQVAAHIVAMVTTGGHWPDGGRASKGSVLMLSAEDDAADTTVPRLAAAGADLSKIGLVEALVHVKDGKRMFSFKDDLPRLKKAVEARPDLKLMVVDPISAYMGAGSVDTFKNSDVRGVLAPLADLASKAGVAVLFVTHFNKGGTGSALNRVTDSLAFTALARSFWAIVAEVKDGIATGRKLMVRIKQNIAAPLGGLAYEIDGVTLPNGVSTSRVRWDGEIDMTADEVLASQQAVAAAPKRNKAESFLLTVLEAGAMESKALIKLAAKEGISEATLRRAKESLEIVHSVRVGKGWGWELLPAEDAHADDPL